MGYLILARGLRVLGPTISAMFSNFLPVTATFVVIKEKAKMEEQSDDREIKPDDVD